MLVEVDLRVVVPVPFRHLVEIVVMIDSYGLVVSLSVHLVHCNGERLTVLSGLCVEIVLAFWILLVVLAVQSGIYVREIVLAIWVPLVVLLVHVLGTLYPHWLMYVHCLVVLVLLVVRIVIPFVHLVVVLHYRR